jgi:phosphoribosyl 1,2-cyclic phosphodiesterase
MGQLTVRFWGVRGSIPAPGPSTATYGGNTSCVEVRAGDELIILDLGSGLRALGESLGRDPVAASLFLSHYHWDHIQGLPFFGPAYNPASTLAIWGLPRDGRDVRAVLAGQMIPPYFPVTLDALRARLSFHSLIPGEPVRVGQALVTAAELNHPNGAVAYRIEHGGKAVVYATDNEHGTRSDDALIALSRGAEAVIYDAMYTEEEYQASKVGWGHSTWLAGARIVERAGAKQLVLFHHEPTRSDEQLDQLLARAREHSRRTILAREGDVLSF